MCCLELPEISTPVLQATSNCTTQTEVKVGTGQQYQLQVKMELIVLKLSFMHVILSIILVNTSIELVQKIVFILSFFFLHSSFVKNTLHLYLASNLWLKMSEYFISFEAYPKSIEFVLHNFITMVRCDPCGLLNPNFILSEPLPLDWGRDIPSLGQEIIEIEKSPAKNKFSSLLIVPIKRQGTATQIPSILNLKLGYAELERQVVDQQTADRKSKTGFSTHIPIVYFIVRIAHYIYDHSIDNGGYWTASSSYFSIDEENRHLTSNVLAKLLFTKVQNQAKQPNVKKWVLCGEKSDLSLAHTNSVKILVWDIAPWPQPKLFPKQLMTEVTSKSLLVVWCKSWFWYGLLYSSTSYFKWTFIFSST